MVIQAMGICSSKERIEARIQEVQNIKCEPLPFWLIPSLIKYIAEPNKTTTCPICINDMEGGEMVYACPFCITRIHEKCFF
jgi:hypothetical protein